jgi:hypothetical protein
MQKGDGFSGLSPFGLRGAAGGSFGRIVAPYGIKMCPIHKINMKKFQKMLKNQGEYGTIRKRKVRKDKAF